jgi:hypothetical protein
MHTSRSLPHRLAAASAAALLGLSLAACGAKGGSDASTSTTEKAAATTTAPAKTTTTEAPTTTTTTTPAADVSDDDLKSLLPTADDIGAPYVVDDTPDDNTKDAGDKAIEEACPEAAEFFNMPDDPHDFKAKFKTDDNRSLEVDLGRNSQGISADKIDELVSAIDKCDTIAYDDGGAHVTGKLTAKRDDSYGDAGIRFGFDFVITGNGQSLPLHGLGLMFVRNGLTGGVLFTSGYDNDTGAPVAGDFERIPTYSQVIDEGLKQLTK